MKEKILAALKSKFPGVKDAILDRIATNKAGTVTDEAQVQSIVDGVSIDAIIDSESDYRASQEAKSASKKAVSDYESKHKLKDGKPLEDPGQKKTDPSGSGSSSGTEGAGGDEPPAWAQQLIKDNQELREKVSLVEKERETSTKRSEVKELLKASKIPQKIQEKWLSRVILDGEESLEDQVKALEAEYLEMKQEHINSTVEGEGGEQGSETSDADMTEYLEDKFPETAEASNS